MSVNIVFPAIVDIKTILFVAGIISGINAGCNSPYVGKIVVKIILYIVRKRYCSIGNSRSFSLCFGRCCLHCSFGCCLCCCHRCCLRRCRCGIGSFGRLVLGNIGYRIIRSVLVVDTAEKPTAVCLSHERHLLFVYVCYAGVTVGLTACNYCKYQLSVRNIVCTLVGLCRDRAVCRRLLI